MNRVVILLAMIGLLGACATVPVEVSSTIFQGEGSEKRGTVKVMPSNQYQDGSLEFESVKAMLQRKLVANGYRVAEENAEFIAFITYGLSDGQTSTTQVPMFGQTGSDTFTTSGGFTYSMPTYGQVGSVTQTQTTYRREINVDIVKPKLDGEVTKMYELRGVSQGYCGNIFAVLPAILEGMFEGFPGASGVPKKSSISMELEC